MPSSRETSQRTATCTTCISRNLIIHTSTCRTTTLSQAIYLRDKSTAVVYREGKVYLICRQLSTQYVAEVSALLAELQCICVWIGSRTVQRRRKECVCKCVVKVSLLLDFHFTFLQDQVLSNDPLPDILDVLNNGLLVGGGIIRAGDENVVVFAGGCWCIQWGDRNKPET